MSGPRLLLVNDDGVGAIGLQKLQAAASSVSDDVWTVAPASERSGNSHAISLTQPLRARQLSEREFAVDGTPVDCVALALSALLPALVSQLLAARVSTFLNINFPSLPAHEISGTQVTRAGSCPTDRFTAHQGEDPRGVPYWWLALEYPLGAGTPGTDLAAVGAGFISITPLRADMTDAPARSAGRIGLRGPVPSRGAGEPRPALPL